MGKFKVPMFKRNVNDDVNLCQNYGLKINLFDLLSAHLLDEIIRFYYRIDEHFCTAAYPRYYSHNTKQTKLATILLIIYYFQLLSYWDTVQMLIVIQFQTIY